MMNIELDNIPQQNAYKMIANTDNSFFLTGRAGTGKTTFLKYVQEAVDKTFLVLAPTGVAAINAGGQTIHSFFGFHFGVLGPGEIGTMNKEKISIIKSVNTIIVDEVSMVRCDIVDAMDRTLRAIRHSSMPFGGVQMIFVGDPFQLEPVVCDDDRMVLRTIYGEGPYHFYNSMVLNRINLPKIEFVKIHRQKDARFVELLEHVRTYHMTEEDIRLINSRHQVGYKGNTPYSIILTSTRIAAQKINDANLAAIEGEEYTYVANFSGDCKACQECVEERLTLKIGAQVMLTKNDHDHRWVNGTIAKVVNLSNETIKIALESGEEYDVHPCTWENCVYKYDEKSKTSKKSVTGVATQYPLRLAWAITIHKSQSLTFEHVAVDFGRRAFAAGQAYVALSRVTSLDGLVLLSAFTPSSILVSDDVASFASDYNDEACINAELSVGEAIRALGNPNDYDTISRALLQQSLTMAAEGDRTIARKLFDKAMEIVTDDDCLKGIDWKASTGDAKIDAFARFYSGDVKGAMDSLDSMGIYAWRDFDCLYLMSRCHEEMEDWDSVEDMYYCMLPFFEDARERGVDSPAFRKFKYRMAILNEAHYGDPGAGLIRMLIKENPLYEKYHVAIRPMLWKLNEVEVAASALYDENELVRALMDETLDVEAFLDVFRHVISTSPQQWKAYLKFLSRLDLEMA